MNPENLINIKAMEIACSWDKIDVPEYTSHSLSDVIDEFIESHRDQMYDAFSEIREGEVETNIGCDYSRHYESKSVAAKINGQWIGWTYWYGGGKHSEPESIDWACDAYFVDVKEKEVTKIERTFTKRK